MAKKKTPPRRRSIAHSDVPLKDRLLVNKLSSIAQHRDHAALIATARYEKDDIVINADW